MYRFSTCIYIATHHIIYTYYEQKLAKVKIYLYKSGKYLYKIYHGVLLCIYTCIYPHTHTHNQNVLIVLLCIYTCIYPHTHTHNQNVLIVLLCIYTCIYCRCLRTCIYIATHHIISCHRKTHHVSPHCSTRHHTAPHCNTLQHTATHCNTPSYVIVRRIMCRRSTVMPYVDNTRQHTAAH